MQQIIQTKDHQNDKNIFLSNSQYHNIKNILDQNQLYKCSQNNYSTFVCFQQTCEKPGLFCGIPKCPCQKNHLKCKNIMIDRIINSILDKKLEMPNQVKQSYQQLFKEINQMIQELSAMRTKFQDQQQYFGITSQQMKFIELIRDNKIEKINGKFVHSMSFSFQSNIQYDVLNKDQIIEDFKEKRKEFQRFCNQILQKYSKKEKKLFQKITLFNDSKILEEIKDKELLTSWIQQIPKNQKNLKIQSNLLFRASQHNFKSAQFHKFCDGIKDTVIIAKNQFNFVVGGYVHPKYFVEPNDSYAKDDKNQSFLFSINEKQKINCNKPQYCVRSYSGYGPVLGGTSSDFYICDNSNVTKSSHFNPFNAYNIGNKYGDQNQTRKKISGDNSSSRFLINQYQVYQIKNLI